MKNQKTAKLLLIAAALIHIIGCTETSTEDPDISTNDNVVLDQRTIQLIVESLSTQLKLSLNSSLTGVQISQIVLRAEEQALSANTLEEAARLYAKGTFDAVKDLGISIQVKEIVLSQIVNEILKGLGKSSLDSYESIQKINLLNILTEEFVVSINSDSISSSDKFIALKSSINSIISNLDEFGIDSANINSALYSVVKIVSPRIVATPELYGALVEGAIAGFAGAKIEVQTADPIIDFVLDSLEVIFTQNIADDGYLLFTTNFVQGAIRSFNEAGVNNEILLTSLISIIEQITEKLLLKTPASVSTYSFIEAIAENITANLALSGVTAKQLSEATLKIAQAICKGLENANLEREVLRDAKEGFLESIYNGLIKLGFSHSDADKLVFTVESDYDAKLAALFPVSSTETNTQTGTSSDTSSSTETATETETTVTYQLTGLIKGIPENESVTLKSNLGEELQIDANGFFTFLEGYEHLDSYSISTFTLPDEYLCYLENESGSFATTANITNVVVDCFPIILDYFFVADDASDENWFNGYLYRTNGREGGTIKVLPDSAAANFYPTFSDYKLTDSIHHHEAKLFFFTATDDTNGTELWASDGSNANTKIIKDINPGSQNSAPTNFTAFGNKLIFSATDGATNGRELWISDGTEAGTKMIKDINTSGDSSPRNMYVWNNKIYFSALTTTYGEELWVSDGIPEADGGTTELLKNIADSTNGSADTVGSSPGDFVSMGGNLYFFAYTEDYGKELWKYDGTLETTTMVKDILPSTGHGLYTFSWSGYRSIIEMGGAIYFTASQSAAEGYELWKSDGSNAGTVLIKNIAASSNQSSTPSMFTKFGDDKIVFSATEVTNGGSKPYISDGTTVGTVKIKEISGTGFYETEQFHILDDLIIFRANGKNGSEPWVSDGTESGTKQLKDVNPGSEESNIADFHLYTNGPIYFFWAETANEGYELWKTDGKTSGTEIVQDLYPGSNGSSL